MSEHESPWRITAWSIEQGLGEVARGDERLPFDGHYTCVHDLRVGEAVSVRIDAGQVTEVRPLDFDPEGHEPRRHTIAEMATLVWDRSRS